MGLYEPHSTGYTEEQAEFVEERNPQPPVLPAKTNYNDRISTILKAISVTGIVMVLLGVPIAIIITLSRSDPQSPQSVSVYDYGSPEPWIATPTVTDTQEPTKTPIPPTATEQKEHNTVSHVQKVAEITNIVYIVETVLVSTTPQPTHTPYYIVPTIDAAQWATDEAIILQYENDKIELQRSQRSNIWAWVLTISGIAAGAFFGILLATSVVKSAWEYWTSKKPTIDKTTETAQQIAERVPQPQIQVNDWRDEMRRDYIVRLRKTVDANNVPLTLREIERRVWPTAKTQGGSHYDFIKATLREYDPLGEYGPTAPPPHLSASV